MDVVGSTAMTQGLDPEDTMEILDKAILHLAVPIEVHGGHVIRYTGAGFKAIFGDPIAREDDPEQAIPPVRLSISYITRKSFTPMISS